jgi:hypothetical protein
MSSPSVYGEPIHTESGAHAKQLESWEHLRKRLRIRGRKVSPGLAKQQFEEIRSALQSKFGVLVKLPPLPAAMGKMAHLHGQFLTNAFRLLSFSSPD